MTRSIRAGYLLAAGLVFVPALLLYWRTLLPDVGTWDTAEFQTIGPVLGIAHPTGYPTYTLLAWLASVVLQPFGNEAERADLLSALLVAGAAALLALRVVGATRRWPLGVLAGLAFAVTPVAWRVATRADAHALHVFLAALLLVLLGAWAARTEADAHAAGRWLLIAAVVYGLSLGNHALTLLLAPGIAVYVLLVAPRILSQQWRLVLACVAAIVVTAVLVYLYLPLRSAMDPPLDYASPDSWRSFWYLVLGEQFQGSVRALPELPGIISRIWDELVRDYGIVVILVPAGAVLGALRHPRLVALTALWFVASWLFALTYANAAIERYYLVPLLGAALWLALGADVLWDMLRDLFGRAGRPAVATASVVVLVAALLVASLSVVPGRYRGQDASNDRFGRTWLEATLEALPPEAVVVSWWSFSTPLWYGQWVEGRRPDVLVVDDRDVLDDGYGSAFAAIERFLGQRPVFIVRRDKDLPAFQERFELERVESVPSPGTLYRVVGPRTPTSSSAD